jgi:hyperosmotically inducible protein
MTRNLPYAAALALLALPAFAMAQDANPPSEPREHPMDNAAEATGDAWITTKVKADLLATKDVSGTDISVDTRDGVVTLTGAVATQAEADRAKRIAAGIKGVTRVDSQLTVGGTEH